jgi:hypothetical protein
MYGGDISAIELGKVKNTEKGFITTIDGAKADYQAYMKDKTRYDLIKQTLEDLTLDDDKGARISSLPGKGRVAPIDTPASLLKRGVVFTKNLGDKFIYYLNRVQTKATSLEDDLADSLIKIANYKLFSKANKVNSYKYELKISDLEARIEPLRLIIEQLKEINDFIIARKAEGEGTRIAKIQKRLQWLKIGNKDFYGLKNDTAVVTVEDGGAGAAGQNRKTNLDALQTQCNTKLTAFGGKLNTFSNITNILKDAQGYLNDKTITDAGKTTEIKKYYEMVWTIVSLGYYDKGDKGFNWGEYIQNKNTNDVGAGLLKAIKQAMPTSLASNVDIKAKNFEKLYATMHLIYYGAETQIDSALTNYGATFDSITDIDPIAAVAGAADSGMAGHVISSITTLTDKKFVLGSTNNHIGVLELNADGTVKSSNLVPTTAVPLTFARQQIAKLNDSTFVVGYTDRGSFSVIDANTRTMLPFGTTALVGVTMPLKYVSLVQNKLTDAATTNAATTNANAAAAITTAIVADPLITGLPGYNNATFSAALTTEITRLLDAVKAAIPALINAAAITRNIEQINNDAGWQAIAKTIITTAITENIKLVITAAAVTAPDVAFDFGPAGNVITSATAITTKIVPIAIKLLGLPVTDTQNIQSAILAQIKTMIVSEVANVQARLTAIKDAPASLLAIANTFFATPLVRAVTQGMCDVIYGNSAVPAINDTNTSAGLLRTAIVNNRAFISDPVLNGNTTAITTAIDAKFTALIDEGGVPGNLNAVQAKLVDINTTANYDAIAKTIFETPIKLTNDAIILSIKCFTATAINADCVCIHQNTGLFFYKTDGTPLTFRATGTAHTLTVNSVFDISPDGTKIAVFESAAADADRHKLFLCDIDYTSKVMTWQEPVVPYKYFGATDANDAGRANQPGNITSISYSPDGSTLAVGLNRPGEYTVACTAQGNDSTQLSLNVKIDMPKADTNIVVYNSGSKEELFRASAPGGPANNVRFSPDGSLIATIVDNRSNYSKYYNLSGVVSAAKVTLAANGNFKNALAEMLNGIASLKMIFNKRRGSEDAIAAATFTADNIEHLAKTPMFLQYMFQPPAGDTLVATVITTLINAIGDYFVAENTGSGIVGMKRLKPALADAAATNISLEQCKDRGPALITNGESDFKLLYKDLSANEAEWNSVEGRSGVTSRYSDSIITKITQLTWCYGGYIAVRLGEIGSRNVQLFDSSDGFYNNSFLTENAAQMLTPAASANLIAFGNTDDSLQIISTNGAGAAELRLRKWDVQYTQLLEAYNKLTASPVSAEVFSDFYNDFQTSLNYFTFQKDFFQNAPTANGNPTGIEYIAMQTIIDDVVKSDPSYDVEFVTGGNKVEKVFENQLTAYVGQLYDDNGNGNPPRADAYKGLNINRNPFKQLYTLNQYDNYNFMVSSQRRIVLNTKMLGPAVLKLDINNFPVVSNEVMQYQGDYYRDYVDYKMSIGKEKSFKYTPHGFGKILYLRNRENPEDLQDTSCKGFFRNGLLFGYADHAYGDISYENNTDAVAYIYRGYWKNDKRYGSGVVYSGKSPSTNKIKFIGNFVDDQRYGNGIEFSDDFEWKDPEKRTGTVYYGYWVNGQFGWANDIYSQRTNVTIYEYKGGRMESKYVGEIRQNEDGKILSQGKGIKTTYGYTGGVKDKETVDTGTFFEGQLSGTDKDNTVRTVKDLAVDGTATTTKTQKGTFVKGQPVKIKEQVDAGAETEQLATSHDAEGNAVLEEKGVVDADPAKREKFKTIETQKTKELDEDQADLQTFNNRDIDKLQGKSVPIVKTNSERRVEVEKQKATDKGRVSALDSKMKGREEMLAVSQAVSQGKYVKIDDKRATAEKDFGIIIFANKNRYIGPIIDNGNTLLISTIKGRLESENGDVLIASNPDGNESAWSKYVLSADIGKYKDPSKLPQPWVSYRPYDIFSIIPKNSAVSAVFAQQEVSNAIMNTSAAGKTFISDQDTLKKMRGIIYRDIVIYVQAYILVIRSILGNNGPKTDANGDPVDSCGRPMLMGGASQMGSDQLVDAGVGQYIDLNLLQQTGGSGIEGTSLVGGNVIQVGGAKDLSNQLLEYNAYRTAVQQKISKIKATIENFKRKQGYQDVIKTLEEYLANYTLGLGYIETDISEIERQTAKIADPAVADTELTNLTFVPPASKSVSTITSEITAKNTIGANKTNYLTAISGPYDPAKLDKFLEDFDPAGLIPVRSTAGTYANKTTGIKTILDADFDILIAANIKENGEIDIVIAAITEVIGKITDGTIAASGAGDQANLNAYKAELEKLVAPNNLLENIKNEFTDLNVKLTTAKADSNTTTKQFRALYDENMSLYAKVESYTSQILNNDVSKWVVNTAGNANAKITAGDGIFETFKTAFTVFNTQLLANKAKIETDVKTKPIAAPVAAAAGVSAKGTIDRLPDVLKTIFDYAGKPDKANIDAVNAAFAEYKKIIQTKPSTIDFDGLYTLIVEDLNTINKSFGEYFHLELDKLKLEATGATNDDKKDMQTKMDAISITPVQKSILKKLAVVFESIKDERPADVEKTSIDSIVKSVVPQKEGDFETYLTDIDLSLTGPNSGYSRFLGEFPDQIKDLKSFPNQTSNFVKEILNAIIMSVSKNTGNLLDGNSQQLDKFDKNQVLLIINKNIIILFNMYLIIISKLPITDPFLVLNLYNGFGVAYEKTYDLIQRENESNLAGFEKNKEEIFENSDTNDFIKSILMAIAVSVAAGGVAAAASGIFTASGGKKYTKRRKVVKRKYRTKRYRKLNLKGRKYVTRKVIKKKRKGKGKK